MNSTDDFRWMMLFKFGQRPHLEDFRNDGLLYMSSQQYFSALEGDLVRGDRFEGTDQIHQPKDIRHIRITNNATGEVVIIKPENMAGPVSIRFGKRPMCNLFCMFAVTEVTDSPLVDERAFEFGDSFIAVLNTQKFVDRICTAASSAGFGHEYGMVEYYDAGSYSGDTGPFRKPSTFAYQQEFRFLVEPGSGHPIKLLVGSLVDITTPIYTLSEINHLVSFGTESASQLGLA